MQATKFKVGQPKQRPEILFCPKCGYDLDDARPRRLGDLYADPMGETFWKGERVHLTATERVVLSSIVTTEQRAANREELGSYTSGLVIAERADLTIDSVKVVITRLRQAFQQVDPDFDHIETATGFGYRFVMSPVARVLCRLPGLVLQSDGTATWQNRYRIFLNTGKGHQLTIMTALMRAAGELVSNRELIKLINAPCRTGPFIAISGIRKKFAEADARIPIIIGDKGNRRAGGAGYRIYLPKEGPLVK